ncbi:hypothetical protein OSTOST_02609, partial [Ostertagia ostertagi]
MHDYVNLKEKHKETAKQNSNSSKHPKTLPPNDVVRQKSFKGIADILAIYMSIFFRLIRPFALGPEIRPVISFFAVLSTVTYFAHMIGNMVIALNRYSAFCLSDKYDKIWRRRNVWIIVALQSVVAFIAASPLIGAGMVYAPNADGTYQFIGLEQQVDL